MPADGKKVARALEEIARLCALKGENPFKCRAFEQAARAISREGLDLERLVESGGLTSVRGIGKSTAEQIAALVQTGRSPLLDLLHAQLPEPLRRLLAIPGLGPKRLRAIHDALGVGSIGELEYAIHENRLRDLPGFGVKSQEALAGAIRSMRRHEGRFLVTHGWEAASEILAAPPRGMPGRIEIAGELRRQMETVSEILLLAERRGGEEDAGEEEIRTAANGVPVRILRRSPDRFEACWLWESCGSLHRRCLEERAASRSLSFRADGLYRNDRPLRASEEEIYRMLDLPFIHPLLREGRPEEVAAGAIPAGPESIRGVFHVHTRDSDGAAGIEEMVVEAKRLGYLWIGISDHSRSAFYANGLSPERLLEQNRAVREIQKRHPGIAVLHGVESDILPDGSLDYRDDVLAPLDFVVASVHSRFRMDRETMTSRIERALRHPATTHWGHPTGRLLLARDGYDCDVERLLAVCSEEGVAVEFNANPHRLDIDWRLIPLARRLGVAVSINPDAHTLEGLADARLTVGTAAKGGLTAEEPLNRMDAQEIQRWLRSAKPTAG